MAELEEVVTPTLELSRGEAVSLMVGCTSVGIGIGLAAGYFAARRHLSKMVEDRVDEKVNEILTARYNTDEEEPQIKNANVVMSEKPDLETLTQELGYAARNGDETVEDEEETPPATDPDSIEETGVTPDEHEAEIVRNVFEDNEIVDEWDQRAEEAAREGATVYIIHRDEFQANETDAHQQTLTYFAGDDILCDEADVVIQDRAYRIGEGTLEKFGHGSLQKEVVYVRNERIGMDFEIMRTGDDYAKVVHGFLEHSSEPMRRRRARFDDD